MPLTERPLRADAERNRRRLLEAAATVIARDGVEASASRRSHARPGSASGTLYRRFACKDDLVRAILAERAEITLREMAPARPRTTRGTRSPGRSRARRPASRATRGCSTRSPRRAGGWLLEVRSRFSTRSEPVLDRARAAGVVRDDVTVTDLRHARLDRHARAPERARGRRPDLGAVPRRRARRPAPGGGVAAAPGAAAEAAVAADGQAVEATFDIELWTSRSSIVGCVVTPAASMTGRIFVSRNSSRAAREIQAPVVR